MFQSLPNYLVSFCNLSWIAFSLSGANSSPVELKCLDAVMYDAMPSCKESHVLVGDVGSSGGEWLFTGKNKPDFTGFLSVLLVRVKIFTRNYSFPLEIHFTMLYSNKCDRRPIRFGPLAQLVRAVGS